MLILWFGGYFLDPWNWLGIGTVAAGLDAEPFSLYEKRNLSGE